jgi:nucleoside-diphosphate-sugar epimerase
MARVLIVGCGCRGQALARELVAAGHAVRGTTRDPARTDAIAAAGAEPYVGDPDRVATLMEGIAQTTIVCWLMGSVDAPDLNAGRLRMLFEKVVDTPVRGVVYEAAGTAGEDVLAGGREIARAAHATWLIPLEVLEEDPADHAHWLEAATAAVDRLMGG